jgi:hypothetical protein
MAPLYDSDLAENRWKEAEWHYFEFQEDIERRERRKRLLWIAATSIVFLLLTAFPVVRERTPAWKAQEAGLRYAMLLNDLKREAGSRKAAVRIVYERDSERLVFEMAASCRAPVSEWKRLREVLPSEWIDSSVRFLTAEEGARLGFTGLVDEVCYDPLAAGNGDLRESQRGLAFAPRADLGEGNLDRLYVLLISGDLVEPQL